MQSSPNPSNQATSRRHVATAFAVLVALVTITYSNHFHNAFHFDDSHTVVQNPYIRDLHNAPLFFTDARTISILPPNQIYRPLLTLSLAIDYWLGGGFDPLWFHISTFFWYLIQLGLMFLFFEKIFDAARPDFRNAWVALFATALYGLHPAMAETVNYVMQRADLYCTLAVIAGLYMYVRAPGLRRYGLYLLPVIAGLLAKQPAAVFPVLLFAWVWLFEEDNLKRAAIRCVPAFLITGAVSYFVLKMNAATYTPSGTSPYDYRISQPAVLLSYFRRFFLPFDLSADTDRHAYSSLSDPKAIFGIVFLLAVTAAIFWCRERRETRPIAFGLIWFIITSLPTSWIVLAELENDHRMFFPFVGLGMSVCWAAALALYRYPLPRTVIAGIAALVLASSAWGAHERNKVWHTDESLWLDVTKKSPGNGRGLMNYGLSQMAQGKYQLALGYFNRALALYPSYPTLEINLGVDYGAMGNALEAERHFQRAIQLAPLDAQPKFFYARWLNDSGRVAEAVTNLRLAVEENSAFLGARDLLMQIYVAVGDGASLRNLARETLVIFPSDTVASSLLAKGDALPATHYSVAATTPEAYLNQSMAFYQAQRYPESIASARKALELRPDYADAWNNIMAAYNSMSEWDQAIAAGEKALSLDPANGRARNNLAWAKSRKSATAGEPKP